MNATIYHGALPLIIDGPDEFEGDDGDLDALRLTVLVGVPWRTAITNAGYARKTKLSGYHSMWVRSLAKTNSSDLTAEVAVEAIGLIDNDPKTRRTLGVAGREVAVGPFERVVIVTEPLPAEEANGDPTVAKRRVPKLNSVGEVEYRTITTPSGSAVRWNIKDAFVTVSDTYYLAAEAAPSMATVGTPQTPANPPTVPTNPWTSYSEPMRGIHPNGWVLDNRGVEQLFFRAAVGETPAAGLWRITDTYGFYYTLIPD
jgi:hypothetical protein